MRAIEYAVLTAMGLLLAYAVAVPVAEFVSQSFAAAAANIEQMGK